MTTILQSRNIIPEELRCLLAAEATSAEGSPTRRRLNRNQSTDYDLEHPEEVTASTARNLSMFSGVFCPVALSQFSTLLFLRIGFVVGQSGSIEFTVQLVLAYTILLLTVLSICAISTNGEISGGGVYFMISRTLGPEFGGSIGVVFFLANVFACGLYLSGFTEVLVENFGPAGNFAHILPGDTKYWKYLYSAVLLLLCLGLCLVGSSLVARISVFVLLILLLSFGSVLAALYFHRPIGVAIPRSNRFVYAGNDTDPTVFYNFTGPRMATFVANAWPHYSPDYTSADASPLAFAKVFAVLFSSVTGIMNGANLSGELKQPSKAIPAGTLLATVFTFTVYLLLGLTTAASCQHRLLINNYNYLIPVNFWPPFVVIGVAAATLSAALGNLIGASRVLCALAKDELFGFVLRPAAVTTAAGNPVRAVLLSFLLVMIVLLIGSLNTIAPVVSCFFLLAYASTNLSCAALDLAAAPNFRPTFKQFHWATALLGMLGCVIMSWLISLVYTPVSLLLMLALMVALHLRDLPHTWGSISQALIYHQVRKYLLKLDSRKSHVKFWRPQILHLISDPDRAAADIRVVNDLKKGGLYVLGHVIVGDFNDSPVDPTEQPRRRWLDLVDALSVKAFVEITLAPSVRLGALQLAWIAGLGGMKPDTVCVGFPAADASAAEDHSAAASYVRNIDLLTRGLPPTILVHGVSKVFSRKL